MLKRGQHSKHRLHTERCLAALDMANLSYERLGSLTKPHFTRQLVYQTIRNRHKGIYSQKQIVSVLARLTKQAESFFYEEKA